VLREVVVLAASFLGEPRARLRALIRRHIELAATQEWPTMAHRTATMNITPHHLAEALQLTLALTPPGQGQQIAQRQIATELEAALDARRQRILISRVQVNFGKWSCLFVQAASALIAIALIQSDNRLATTITMGLFAIGVAASVLLARSGPTRCCKSCQTRKPVRSSIARSGAFSSTITSKLFLSAI
jgi:hypothetical protein